MMMMMMTLKRKKMNESKRHISKIRRSLRYIIGDKFFKRMEMPNVGFV